ncbi:MAG: DUF2339 domain-containing protein [Lysobacteraceae bacterium]
MDDLAGILTLLGLVVLSVPILLVAALIKLGNARARIDGLERDVQDLHVRVSGLESRPVPLRAPGPAEAAETRVARPPAVFAPPPAVLADEPAPAPEPQPMRPAAAVPPPLPERPASAAPTARPADPLPPRPQPQPQPQAWTPPEPQRDVVGDAAGRAGDARRRWFTEGNVPVKIGMLVLLAGVASLLKYASDQGWMVVPIEVRLAGVAAAALGGLVFAWRQRETRRAFSLSLQGGAIGVLMLVTFAAFKLYGLMPAGAAFAITIALVAGLGVLAVLQESMALAVFGILAGFLAPIWLSTGSGNHVALFSYYAVLNLGIFGIAWNRPWRLLNLLGFVFTFAIGTLWGVLDYEPAKFATTEPFLVLFFVLYLLIPVFYAHRRTLGAGGNVYRSVDGALVIGTPLVVFALQAGLLHGAPFGDDRMPLALSALAMAAVYAALAGALRRHPRFAPLLQTWAVLAVGFATLAVPLALSARATASVFAVEGAVLVWLGVRQEKLLPQFTGLGLQLAAAVAYMAGVGGMSTGFSPMDVASATPIANPAFMSALLIAIAGFGTAWTYRRTLDVGVVSLIALWGLGWWTFAGGQEVLDHVPYRYRVDAMFAFLVATGWLTAEVRRRVDEFAAFGGTAALAPLLGVPFAMIQSAEHMHPFAQGGTAAWLLFAVAGWRTLVCLRDTGLFVRLAAHAGWWWSWVLAIALGSFHLVYHGVDEQTNQAMGDGWRILALGLPVLLFAAALRLRPSLLAPPLARGFDDYRGVLMVSAAAVLAFGWLLSLFFPGDSDPLPWVTVLNPLELFQLAALALLAQGVWAGDRTGRTGVPLFALAAFGWITFATLRGVHHWGGVAWSPAMLGDSVVQTSLTVVWSALGVLGWIFGSRRGDRLLWGAGAVLMGVVLLKLLLVDRGNLGDIFGIVSFIAYGLLCAAVGYFAPAPPRRAAMESVA